MALPQGTLAAMKRPAASSIVAAYGVRPVIGSVQRIETGRRGLVSLFLLATTISSEDSSDSKTALLQEYLRRSKDNKIKNDKERLDDYYKRNYRDYFELFEGSVQDKDEKLLSDTEKGIRKWLQQNKK